MLSPFTNYWRYKKAVVTFPGYFFDSLIIEKGRFAVAALAVGKVVCAYVCGFFAFT